MRPICALLGAVAFLSVTMSAAQAELRDRSRFIGLPDVQGSRIWNSRGIRSNAEAAYRVLALELNDPGAGTLPAAFGRNQKIGSVQAL